MRGSRWFVLAESHTASSAVPDKLPSRGTKETRCVKEDRRRTVRFIIHTIRGGSIFEEAVRANLRLAALITARKLIFFPLSALPLTLAPKKVADRNKSEAI